MTGGERYVAAAYVVFLVLVLVYVAIISAKLSRLDRELAELADLAEREGGADRERTPAAIVEEVGTRG